MSSSPLDTMDAGALLASVESPEDAEQRVLQAIDDAVLSSGLTVREERFVRLFFTERSANTAALAAGYASATAAEAFKWLDPGEQKYKPKVHQFILLKQEAYSAVARLEVSDLVRSLRDIVFTDPLDLVDENGRLKEISEIPEAARRSIKELTQTTLSRGKDGAEVIRTTIKLHDKQDAIDKLLKVLGGYERDNLQRASQTFVVLATPDPRNKVVEGRADDAAHRRNAEDVSQSDAWAKSQGLAGAITIKPT